MSKAGVQNTDSIKCSHYEKVYRVLQVGFILLLQVDAKLEDRKHQLSPKSDEK